MLEYHERILDKNTCIAHDKLTKINAKMHVGVPLITLAHGILTKINAKMHVGVPLIVSVLLIDSFMISIRPL
jgi:hypothetical protein